MPSKKSKHIGKRMALEYTLSGKCTKPEVVVFMPDWLELMLNDISSNNSRRKWNRVGMLQVSKGDMGGREAELSRDKALIMPKTTVCGYTYI